MSDRPPVRRIILPGLKDESGAYVPEAKDLDIDKLMQEGLELIHGVLRCVRTGVKGGAPSRNDVMNLKDAMAMLHALKEKEQDILDEMSDEELEAELDKRGKRAP